MQYIRITFFLFVLLAEIKQSLDVSTLLIHTYNGLPSQALRLRVYNFSPRTSLGKYMGDLAGGGEGPSQEIVKKKFQQNSTTSLPGGRGTKERERLGNPRERKEKRYNGVVKSCGNPDRVMPSHSISAPRNPRNSSGIKSFGHTKHSTRWAK
jgi:hypothetical protein